jgi:Tfp pilus assembly protein PilP
MPTRDKVLAAVARARIWLAPYARQLAALAAIAIIGLLAGLRQVLAPIPADLTQDRWALPAWQPYRAGALRDEVLAAEIWTETPGQKKAAQPQAQVQVPLWRFVGTVEAGAERLALVEIDGTRLQRIGVGQELPNGARIQAVGVGELTYAESGSDHVLKLFDVQKPDDGKSQRK